MTSNDLQNRSRFFKGSCKASRKFLRLALSHPWRCVALAMLVCTGPAHAQLRLGPLQGMPALQGLRLATPLPLTSLLDRTLAPLDLTDLRLSAIASRQHRYSRELDRDPHGELIVRAELLAQPSGEKARAAMLAAGFVVLREEAFEGLDVAWLVMRPPSSMGLTESVEWAHAVDPGGVYDYHHVYLGSGSVDVPVGVAAGPSSSLATGASGAATQAGALRIGLIDSGVDYEHPVFKGATVRRHGCDDRAHPAAHGTAAASLMVGQSGPFLSALPRATLFAGDAYCDAPTGGSVEAIARELAWLARERVAVVNVSLVGPANQMLERIVESAIAKGMILVAAVGNDGPAAPPLYPASWPGVVGVGAVDGRGKLLPEGARGPQVMFVAPGADMAAAAAGRRGFVPVRGTSFAAPLVAGLLAASHQQPSVAGARDALARLERTALDPGTTSVRDGYGHGLVAQALRTPPEAVTLVRER